LYNNQHRTNFLTLTPHYNQKRCLSLTENAHFEKLDWYFCE